VCKDLLVIFFLLVCFINLSVGQSDDPFAEFDTEVDDSDIIISDDNDIEVEPITDHIETESPVEPGNDDIENTALDDNDEDFEGLDDKKAPISNELNIVKAPLNMKGRWDHYYLEIVALIGVFVYALNFYTGKCINNRLANAWFEHHKKLLSQAFCIVGDDGVSKEVSEGVLVKESENRFVIWCTGRVGCEGMKIEIKLIRRQDLISVLSQIFKPQSDTITITVYLAEEDMDHVVLAVMPKKGIKRLQQEVQDLSHFASEKKGDKYELPSHIGILAEFTEVANDLLTNPVCKTIAENSEVFDSLHFSDYYTGFKLSNDNTEAERPVPQKNMIFNFLIPGHGKRTKSTIMNTTEPVLRMALHLMAKVYKFKLSKENKMKAERHRVQVEEEFLKQTHNQRQEAAQARKEERRRVEKEKVQELEPDAQRRYEEREHKKSMRRSGPRVKQLKVKTG